MKYGHFKNLVLMDLPGESRRQGAKEYIEQQIIHALCDLQFYIPTLKNGHRQTYVLDDMGVSGDAHYTALPDGMVTRVYHLTLEDGVEVARSLLKRFGSGEADKLRYGGESGWVIHDRHLLVFPQLDADHSLEVVWSGMKRSFSIDDEVIFDERCAQAAALYVAAQLARRSDNDLNLYATYGRDYAALRQQIFLHEKDLYDYSCGYDIGGNNDYS